MNSINNPDGEFGFGTRHIDPVKAISPGLVYEAFEDDYVKFLCSIGYTTTELRSITGDDSSCPGETKDTPMNLNYPSFAAHVIENKPFNITFSRAVTIVGLPNST
ncbi:hypothetical protein EZV62_002766 [Acer yangbiense]|uniref:Subtilisin-like protease fibronectin type-III domain-containing protein n=1 Tax=Acer yangbiense TaxID=1000413 RepID=A0A5C7IY17_9ROSI|nr:hypothetical protein EZV62_002766 [Acer yangbiense]